MWRRIVWLTVCGILAAIPATAEEETIGVFKRVRGDVFIERQAQRIPVSIGTKLRQSDVIVTASDGGAGVILRDNSLFTIGGDSQVSMQKFDFDPGRKRFGMLTRVVRGTMTYLSGLMAKLNRQAIRFETPTAVCGIRGTHIAIEVKGK